MATVTVTGPGVNIGHFDYQGITFYGWNFPVIVDGQAGIGTCWIDSDDPAVAEQIVVDELQQSPGDLGGIADNDPDTGDYGDYGDYGDEGDEGGDDDGGDTAVAGNEGGGFGDSV